MGLRAWVMGVYVRSLLTPVVGFSLWCWGVKAHQQKRGTAYGGRHSKASEREVRPMMETDLEQEPLGHEHCYTHTPLFTMSVCPDPLGPVVLLTVWPVPKYMINV